MLQHQADFRIKCMPWVLRVSGSGFYACRRRTGQKTPSQLRRETCDSPVASTFAEHKGYNGARRLYHDLLAKAASGTESIEAGLYRHGSEPEMGW